MLLSHYNALGLVEAGVDEAGRGCLAGPVYAAAVILPPDYRHPGLNDSKQLSARRRYALRADIERDAVAWAVGTAGPEEIDRLNILGATFLAMHRALDGLRPVPGYVIVDGNRFRPWGSVPWTTIVKGDARYAAIAAASILAKTWRDDYMHRLHAEFPQYGWDRNAGYPTAAHRAALRRYGPTPYHRRSFRLLPEAEPDLFAADVRP